MSGFALAALELAAVNAAAVCFVVPEERSAARSFARLPLAAMCGPILTVGPAEYTGLGACLTPGEAGDMGWRSLRPSTDSPTPDSDFGSTGSRLLAKKVLAPSR